MKKFGNVINILGNGEGNNVKNTIKQLRKKEQRKRYNAVVAAKQQKIT